MCSDQGGVRCGLVATRDMGSSQLPALRRWFGCAITVIMLIELGACAGADHPPSVPAGTADSSPTVVPGAVKGSRTAQPVAPKRPRTAVPKTQKSSETIQPVAPKNPGRSKPSAAKKPSGVVPPDHIVVVIFENEHRSNVIGNPRAAYLNKLAGQGANMTRSYGITHPSQPNYLALFSGTTHGVSSNACLQRFKKKQNLGSQLRRAGLSFTGYAEALPKTGFTGCVQGRYQRKHNPWVNFANLPRSSNKPFSAFPQDYRKLPTVSFVSPDMCNSMHDCSIHTGDRWMKKHFARYAKWAKHHNSLLVVTFDENAGGSVHPIPTIIVGAGIRPGRYADRMNHYTLLRTFEKVYGLPPLGRARAVRPLSGIWKKR
jgi:Phosphoesterase family